MLPILSCLLAARSAVALAAPLQAPSPDLSPGPRNAHAAVYDSRNHALVLFGGATATEVRADLWRWIAGSWRPSSATGPAPRTFPAMTYDSVRDEVVLFGGSPVLFGVDTVPHVLHADTWLLRGDEWRRVSDSGPAPRAEAAVAYDPRRGRTVLFGGRSTSHDGQIIRFGDTWEWDGARWTRVSTAGPSPRSGAAMAWHPGLQAFVLFGGSGGPLSDTWTWDGRAWAPLPLPPASGRFNTVMAWDPAAQRLVRFGGWDGKGRTADTWELRETGWVQVQDDGPSPRNHAVLVSAPDRRSLLLYGGHDGDMVFGDLWERRNGRWMRLEGTSPTLRVLNGH